MRGAVKVALVLAALTAVPVLAATDTLTASTGRWVRLFVPDIERAVGYSVRVDAASVTTSGTVRGFREAEVMLRAQGSYPQGTTLFLQRRVACAGSEVQTLQWRVIGPTGAVLGTSTTASAAAGFGWDTLDGKVLKYVCTGTLPR
jgi:hypothetical protein